MNAAHDFRIINRGGRVLSEYDTLVDQLADYEPRGGYTHADQLRPLTSAEVRMVSKQKPVDLNDVFVRDFDVTEFEDSFNSPLVIAARFAFMLEKAARHVAFHDVQDECERRSQFEAWNR